MDAGRTEDVQTKAVHWVCWRMSEATAAAATTAAAASEDDEDKTNLMLEHGSRWQRQQQFITLPLIDFK